MGRECSRRRGCRERVEVLDEREPELGEGRQHLGLGPAGQQRGLALHCGDRVHGVRGAGGVSAGFGEAKVTDLPGADQFADRPHVLDRDVRVDAVLVKQVIRSVRSRRREWSATRRICSGRLSRPTDLPWCRSR